jgi:hypothetical protein
MKQHLVSAATKRRYQEARKRFGYAPSNNYIEWARLAKRTTFIWKFEALPDAVKWVFESSARDFEKFPEQNRADIAMHYASKAFGVAISDLLDDQRNVVVFVPRAIIINTLKLSGMSINETARQMKRDPATVKNAIKKHKHLFEGLSYGIFNPGNLGLTSQRSAEQDGPISS